MRRRANWSACARTARRDTPGRISGPGVAGSSCAPGSTRCSTLPRPNPTPSCATSARTGSRASSTCGPGGCARATPRDPSSRSIIRDVTAELRQRAALETKVRELDLLIGVGENLNSSLQLEAVLPQDAQGAGLGRRLPDRHDPPLRRGAANAAAGGGAGLAGGRGDRRDRCRSARGRSARRCAPGGSPSSRDLNRVAGTTPMQSPRQPARDADRPVHARAPTRSAASPCCARSGRASPRTSGGWRRRSRGRRRSRSRTRASSGASSGN